MQSLLFILILWGSQVSGLRHMYDYHAGYNPNNSDRPCATYDLDCIRSFFAHNTGCLPVNGSPKMSNVITITYHIPQANMSLTSYNAVFNGITDGVIKEFYIDRKYDTLVLELMIDSIKIDSPNTVATYYFPGRVPLEISDTLSIHLRNVSLTLIIQQFHDPKWARSSVYPYLYDANPPMSVGPALREPADLVANWASRDRIGMTLRETHVQAAPVFMDIYLRNRICDIGQYYGPLRN